MRKKVLAVVSALVITTLAFTGCGGNKSASSDNGSDSGAKSQAITVVSREEGSGTRGAFVELLGVVDENENDITVSSAQITNSTSVMLQKVAQTKSAIGYVSLGSLSTDVKAVRLTVLTQQQKTLNQVITKYQDHLTFVTKKISYQTLTKTSSHSL